MSITDFEIEPNDEELCQIHFRYRPCRECKAEAAEFRAESKKEESGSH